MRSPCYFVCPLCNYWTNWQIFTKFGTNFMPLEEDGKKQTEYRYERVTQTS